MGVQANSPLYYQYPRTTLQIIKDGERGMWSKASNRPSKFASLILQVHHSPAAADAHGACLSRWSKRPCKSFRMGSLLSDHPVSNAEQVSKIIKGQVRYETVEEVGSVEMYTSAPVHCAEMTP